MDGWMMAREEDDGGRRERVKARSLTPLGVRALQRKLNLLLALFWYLFFHMCLPALLAS